MKNEIPIRVIKCREELGIGATLMSAVLNKMGIAGARRVMKSRVAKFLADNPTFSLTSVYPKSKAPHDTAANHPA